MNEPWAIESILNGTGGGGGGGNPIPPITNIYVPVEAWQYQDRIIDVVGFPWVADVPYPNVKASDFVSVIFGQEDAESGIFSNVCESRTDAVRIFASEKPTKRVRIDTLSGFRPNASNSIWGHITGDIQTQQDLVDFVGDSNKIESITANGTPLAITNKEVNIPLASHGVIGLSYGNTSYTNVYVSPNGSDETGNGTSAKPWREIQTAVERTASRGYKWVQIDIFAGTYNTPIVMDYNYPDYYLLFRNGDSTIPSVTCKQVNGRVILRPYPTSSNLNIVTDEDIGISLYNGCSLSKQNGALNITANVRGIRINNADDDIGNRRWCISSLYLTGATTINLIKSGYGIHSDQFSGNIAVETLNFNAPSGAAINLSTREVMTVSVLNTSLAQYILSSGSVLSIGGKWVNQQEV